MVGLVVRRVVIGGTVTDLYHQLERALAPLAVAPRVVEVV